MGTRVLFYGKQGCMYISKHTVWGNYEMMNISCCQILESPHRIGVNVSLIMGPKEQILPLMA